MRISALLSSLFRNKPEKSDNFCEAVITRVVDGDTVIANVNNESTRIRLLGVDTPETVHPKKGVEFYGKEASDFTKKQLTGKRVYLEYDKNLKDRYNRTLAYIWLAKPSKIDENTIANNMFNAVLLRQGFGKVMIIRPNNKYEAIFKKFEANARKKYLGLWQQETTTFKVIASIRRFFTFFSSINKALKIAHIM